MSHYLNTDCLFLKFSCEAEILSWPVLCWTVSVCFNCLEFMAFLCYGVNLTRNARVCVSVCEEGISNNER